MPENQQLIIWQRFYKKLTYKQAAEASGITPDQARRLEERALIYLRKNTSLRRFYLEDIESRTYSGTGLASWKSRGSVEERLVERQEEKAYRLAASSTKHLSTIGATISTKTTTPVAALPTMWTASPRTEAPNPCRLSCGAAHGLDVRQATR